MAKEMEISAALSALLLGKDLIGPRKDILTVVNDISKKLNKDNFLCNAFFSDFFPVFSMFFLSLLINDTWIYLLCFTV